MSPDVALFLLGWPTMIARAPLAVAVGAAAVVVAAAAAGVAPWEGKDEVLLYRWRLGGSLKGHLARIVLPGRGDGKLETRYLAGDRVRSELSFSSPGHRGEYFLQGSEFPRRGAGVLKAWAEQSFRGKEREKAAELGGETLWDIPSSIHRLRRELPDQALALKIWSNGRVYPIEIRPAGRGTVELDGGPVATRCYAVRGVHHPEERFWDGKMDLVFAEDGRSTPVEIAVWRKGVRVRLQLLEADGGSSSC